MARAVGGAIDPSGAIPLAGASGASESEIAEGPVASAVAALAAVNAARDAMNSAKREMIEAGSVCLSALIAYAQRLGEHKAYAASKEAHRNQAPLRDVLPGNLLDDMKNAEGELDDAIQFYNKLADLDRSTRPGESIPSSYAGIVLLLRISEPLGLVQMARIRKTPAGKKRAMPRRETSVATLGRTWKSGPCVTRIRSG